MGRRRPLSKARRWQVLERDGFTCRYCGRTPDDGVKLEVDHLHPVSKGGRNTDGNLVTACVACNRGKRDTVIPLALMNHVARAWRDHEEHERIRDFGLRHPERGHMDEPFDPFGDDWHRTPIDIDFYRQWFGEPLI